MSITREQVADLQPGDVVELREDRFPAVVTRGPITRQGGTYLGSLLLCWSDGRPATWTESSTLTVVSRAPRPLYVNHPRTEPVAGDIVRDCDGDAWRFERDEWWCASADACEDDDPDGFPIGDYRPLTLLWDGETGQVVR